MSVALATSVSHTFLTTTHAVFYGVSVVLFISTLKFVNGSTYARSRAWARPIIGLLAVLGSVAHFCGPSTEGSVAILVSSWVAGCLLVQRGYTLARRARWALVLLGSMLLLTIGVEAYCFVLGHKCAHLIYPTANLILCLGVTTVVIPAHFVKRSNGASSRESAADMFVDSGVLLTVAYAVQVWILWTCRTDASRDVILGLLPHIQNMVSCSVICRIMTDEEDEYEMAMMIMDALTDPRLRAVALSKV